LKSDSDSDESDEEEHEPRTPRLKTTRRASVCAEKLCVDKIGLEVVKKVAKTEEELEKIHTILKKCVLFEQLDESQLQKVKDAMFPVIKEEEDVIIKQGDDGDNFYIIECGNVDVFIDGSGDNLPALVNSYNDRDSFGELAIMYNAPRAATCIAKGGQVKLWALDRVSFKVILMKTAISKRIQYKSFLKEVPILSELDEHEILAIAE
jgi:cAMP-dependent protein kinase regulator